MVVSPNKADRRGGRYVPECTTKGARAPARAEGVADRRAEGGRVRGDLEERGRQSGQVPEVRAPPRREEGARPQGRAGVALPRVREDVHRQDRPRARALEARRRDLGSRVSGRRAGPSSRAGPAFGSARTTWCRSSTAGATGWTRSAPRRIKRSAVLMRERSTRIRALPPPIPEPPHDSRLSIA
jgi:hypothetical protein